MNETALHQLHIDPAWGLFVGQFEDNVLHRHYALQISVSSNESFNIRDEFGRTTSYKMCFINSNVPHQYQSQETSLIILINPLSSLGHQLYTSFRLIRIKSLEDLLSPISFLFKSYLNKEISFSEFVNRVRAYLHDFQCQCEKDNHFEDDRIYNAIQYLDKNCDRIVSLKEIASYCYLSETRFLHLFKEKTNLNFRRYQLWNKLIKSLPYLRKHSITTTAHEFGFTDSSHYSRTFKETFGLNPKLLFRKE